MKTLFFLFIMWLIYSALFNICNYRMDTVAEFI